VSEKLNQNDPKVQTDLLHVILDAYSLKTVAEHELTFRDETIDIDIDDEGYETSLDDDTCQYRTRSSASQIFVWNKAK
jgi:predicted transcriptional regulator